MMSKEQGVKPESDPPPDSSESKVKVDERGVPLLNKIRELERKLEAMERERKYSESSNVEEEQEVEDKSFKTKQQLSEFVENPEGYVSGILAKQRWGEETVQAENWVRNQPGYSTEDDVNLVRIMREYGLQTSGMFPLQRAKTSWKILQSEKAEKSRESLKSEEERTTKVKSTSPEGSGRVVPLKTGPSRAELLKQLATANAKGDFDEEIRVNELIEDMTYRERNS